LVGTGVIVVDEILLSSAVKDFRSFSNLLLCWAFFRQTGFVSVKMSGSQLIRAVNCSGFHELPRSWPKTGRVTFKGLDLDDLMRCDALVNANPTRLVLVHIDLIWDFWINPEKVEFV
jgi:hypothetical protein